jgi:hypothetical protein
MAAGRTARALLVSCALAALARCTPKLDSDPWLSRAVFGVYYGGQVQDRTELAFELDPAKQGQGFRVEFREPLPHALPISWEIGRPLSGKTPKIDGGQELVVEVGEASARAGEQRLDVPVSLRQGQVLGTWHLRLKVDGRVALDRDLLVFDPRERRDRSSIR